ncbi:hypothetical protein KCG48_01275 [Proteiniclasticum sp. BAD-10]|uniref:Competence protein ComGF n=1 Tax=Proteiniclasticum sediminis TaxID=2804028 RepID=A0A941HQA9_9CLOT|nr:hypothetical protein [Proteiniclasticum sediminis]MBR0574962.1 hypothetical protein [Proteiniclasticum sediminis]
MLLEVLVGLVTSFLLFLLASRLYLAQALQFQENLDFLLETDYAYHAFEVIKKDLYTDTRSVALLGNVLYIRKEDYVNAPYIRLEESGGRLRYAFGKTGFQGTTYQYLSYGVKSVTMRQVGSVVFIRLQFSKTAYERGFWIEPQRR